MASDFRHSLWRGLGHLLAPAVTLWLQRRAATGKEDAARLPERFGHAALARPAGRLVWCHGASVGEAQALLPLLQHLHAARPDLTLLLTTGTVTSAELVRQRAIDGVIHQFVPVDLPGAVDRFLDHWRPDLVLWSESDFWPGILAALRQRRIPALLVNARMSERSCRRWALAPQTARWLLRSFAAIYAQTTQDAERLRQLGAAEVIEAGNLKQAAPPLPANAETAMQWQMTLGSRPRWLAASTHPGEEAQIAGVHRALKSRFPGLLTIIVPRHPQRGPEIATALSAADSNLALRSRSEAVTEATDIYIADTLGELGLWYRLCPIVMMGGSLIPHGGQNPLEPARLDCALLFGPSMFNFSDAVAGLLETGGAQQVQDAAELTVALSILLNDPAKTAEIAAAARAYAGGQNRILDTLRDAALRYLPS
ncbi:3-deoxy-D-manno-octulosonic acid transferase [Ferrovibrio sp.]|uniref:3-deoxy-D-manno-octulosonic acid transferase n=1 Tax=Ferrovibrio sp. TaxID=1917215 RepID=UPI0026286AF0|nr:3-deoxy-D-manno-octulosonic acid transferase [Ferrovibrio sp.]